MAGPVPAFFVVARAETVARMSDSDIRDDMSTGPGCRFAHPGYGISATGKFQRSAKASLAPSAANPAAKLRRSQAIAFGRVMTRSRKEAANRP